MLSDLGNWLLLSAAVPIMLLTAGVTSGPKPRQPAEPALAFLAATGVWMAFLVPVIRRRMRELTQSR